MADDPEVMTKFPLVTWTPDTGQPIQLAINSIVTSVEARLVKRARPYRKGFKLDSTRRDGLVFTLEAVAFNGCTENGIPDPSYPQIPNALEDSIDIDQTGTLVHPRRGPQRVRLKSLKTTETSDVRDAATISLTFWEDTEDAITLQSFTPSAISSIGSAGTQMLNDAQDLGIWNDDVQDLSDSLDTFTSLLSSAADLADDLAVTIGAIVGLCAAIADTFGEQYDDTLGIGSTVALDPEAAPFLLGLRRISNLASNALKIPAADPIVSVTYATTVSVFDVAAERGADVGDIISLNTGRIPPGDFYAIPPGTSVLVYANSSP
jgi:hypothetical protein